jgi:hypothetical protein
MKIFPLRNMQTRLAATQDIKQGALDEAEKWQRGMPCLNENPGSIDGNNPLARDFYCPL